MKTALNRSNALKLMGCFLVFSATTYGSILIEKFPNSLKDSGKTTPFFLSSKIKQTAEGVFFGAHPSVNETDLAQEHSLSRIPFENHCFPIAPKTVALNGEMDKPNPLYDTGISHLDLLSTEKDSTFMEQMQGRRLKTSIVAVTTKDPSKICLLENELGNSVRVTESINDAHGNPTKEIIKITGASGDKSFVVAAVTNDQGEFGKNGSGLAVVNTFKHVTGTGEVKEFFFGQLDGQFGESEKPRSFPLDIATSAAKIQGDLAAMGSVVDMCWDPTLNRLYVALHVTAGAQEGDGARALIIAGFATLDGKITLLPIAPDDLFTGNNQIVGARGANESVSLHSVQTMWTTMKMPYLVVVGGNGKPEETKNCVYALPLTNHREKTGDVSNSIIHGTLAAKNANPIEFYSESKPATPSFLLNRVIHSPALIADDAYTSEINQSNAPILVGGGPLKAGDIQQIFIKGDAIHALVIHSKDTDAPGLYHSQALFDAQGKVSAWTNWKRTAHLDNNVKAVALDRNAESMITFSGVDEDHIDTIESTLWYSGQKEGRIAQLNNEVQKLLPKEVGGVQGLFEFSPETTPGIGDMTILVVTGLKTVLVVPTDHKDAAIARDLKQNPLRIANLKCDVLDKIGAVSTVDIVPDLIHGTGSLLFVGGTKGVAVLTDEQNKGWNIEESLSENENTQHMTFKIIGNYRSISKVIGDGHYLYILTKESLDRIDIRDSSFTPITIVRACDFAKPSCFFSDVLVSRECILLATNNGLFKKEIASDWEQIVIPGNTQTVYSLSAASVTGRAQDLISDVGGMLYTLSGLQSSNRSSFSRLAVSLTDSGVKIDPLPDKMLNAIPQPFILFDTFKKYCVTDGASYFHASERNLLTHPILKTGVARLFKELPFDFSNASSMTTTLYNNSLNSWIIAGDFGIKGNE